MPRVGLNTNDSSFPMMDTYADAILRTFASLKPSSLTTLHYHHAHPLFSTVSVYCVLQSFIS